MPNRQAQLRVVSDTMRGLSPSQMDTAKMVALLVIVELAFLVGLRTIFRTVHGG